MTSGPAPQMRVRFAEDYADFEDTLQTLVDDQVASRIFAKDATLWGAQAEPEAAVRLGWTADDAGMSASAAQIEALRVRLLDRGIDRVLLCGMGGSSLAPAVISRWAGVALDVLDSTHPATVIRALNGDLSRTVVVVSSKSGSTIETRSHRTVFENAFRSAGLDPAEHIVVVTDPGSPLEDDARSAGQIVFNADPEVGGRFSALTSFGLVPAGLSGANATQLLTEAEAVRSMLATDSTENPALQIAAALARGLPGKYVLGLISGADAQWGLGAWIEQLIAESTGKNGQGVLPIALPEDAPEQESHAHNTILIYLRENLGGSSIDAGELEAPGSFTVAAPLGAQFLLWEVATAALGRLMGIDPFNQPDVEAAKVAAREVLSAPEADVVRIAPLTSFPEASVLMCPASASAPESAADVISTVAAMVPENGYLCIQAYLDPKSEHAEVLASLRNKLAERLGVPVALGWGPRYLHSVGQLHKGGPKLGAFLQICEEQIPSLEIPNSENGFDELIAAQARGDRNVLVSRGRPVLAVSCSQTDAALRELLAAV